MTRHLRLKTWAMSALTLILMALAFTPVAYGQSGADPVKVRIEIDDLGFPGGDPDFTVEVEQGRLVEMTFVWAHKGYLQEEHVMVLDIGNTRLEWDKLDFQNREATLKFIATDAGTFDFKCDLHCEVHDYIQKGHLVVKRGGGGGASLTPSTLEVIPSAWVSTGDPISLTTRLTDPNGNPVSKAPVRFYLDATFAGTKEKMPIGTVKTDANGIAFLDYAPTVDMEKHVITARFAGMGVFDKSETALEISQALPAEPAYEREPGVLQLFWDLGPPTLTVATMVVWALLLFILFQGISVAWVRKG